MTYQYIIFAISWMSAATVIIGRMLVATGAIGRLWMLRYQTQNIVFFCIDFAGTDWQFADLDDGDGFAGRPLRASISIDVIGTKSEGRRAACEAEASLHAIAAGERANSKSVASITLASTSRKIGTVMAFPAAASLAGIFPARSVHGQVRALAAHSFRAQIFVRAGISALAFAPRCPTETSQFGHPIEARSGTLAWLMS